jgi:hypothetical protein
LEFRVSDARLRTLRKTLSSRHSGCCSAPQAMSQQNKERPTKMNCVWEDCKCGHDPDWHFLDSQASLQCSECLDRSERLKAEREALLAVCFTCGEPADEPYCSTECELGEHNETPHVAPPSYTPELKQFGLQGWAWIVNRKQIGPRFRTESAARNWREQSKTQPTLRRRNNF